MPRLAAKPRTYRVTITTTEQVKTFLERLIPLGLYGNSVSEVAERLVCEGLRSRTIKQEIKILEGDRTAPLI